MREEFLHFIWRFKKLDLLHLYTSNNQKIDVFDFGQYNTDAGPDFLNAKIKIDGKEWSGHIEMHTTSSDWNKHNHQRDPQYQNVILHVVYEADVDIFYSDTEETIPCLILKNKIDLTLYNKYERLLAEASWIPCENYLDKIDKDRINLLYYNFTVERIGRKAEDILTILKKNNDDWDQTIFIAIARGFGLKVNADGFEALCSSTPINILRKHTDHRNQIEAILYGQSGFLTSKFKDQYPTQLLDEYRFLQHKYNLTPISPTYWKFLRLRPPNFPTLRISQFAHLLSKNQSFYSLFIEESVSNIQAAFADIYASSYWNNHYRFDKTTEKEAKKNLGQNTIDLILINSVAPLIFMYGKKQKSQEHIDKSIKLLEMVAPEKNKIISTWNSLGFKSDSAFDTQALLQLKKEYCTHKRCLQCSIGYQLLSK